MDLTALRKRCEGRLKELALDLPTPFDVRAFCRALVMRRGRPIELLPIVGTRGPCGLWIASDEADYIFYEQQTSRLHQEHIILHEVCHVLCGHQPTPVSHADLSRLFPDMHPDTVQRLLQRGGYSTEEEREAELLASLILEQTARRLPRAVSIPDGETAGLLGRLEASLEDDTWSEE